MAALIDSLETSSRRCHWRSQPRGHGRSSPGRAWSESPSAAPATAIRSAMKRCRRCASATRSTSSRSPAKSSSKPRRRSAPKSGIADLARRHLRQRLPGLLLSRGGVRAGWLRSRRHALRARGRRTACPGRARCSRGGGVMPTVLVLTAHGDDMEFYAGGTIAKLCMLGYDVHLVIATDNTKGTFELSRDEMFAVRLSEARSGRQGARPEERRMPRLPRRRTLPTCRSTFSAASSWSASAAFGPTSSSRSTPGRPTRVTRTIAPSRGPPWRPPASRTSRSTTLSRSPPASNPGW